LNRSLCRALVFAAVFAAAAPVPMIHAAQETGLTQAAKDAGEAYVRALLTAGALYAQRDFTKALDKLDVADQIHPDVPDTWYLRGAIYAEQHNFDKAKEAFEKAAKLNPGDFWPQYNLAELLLMQKKYGPAAEAFKGLEVFAGHQELIQFKIVFAELLLGNPDAAKPVLDAMKIPCDTPAYYFAHASWGFAHKDEKEGNDWTAAGLKIFGPGRCLAFYDSLVAVGWLPMRNADGSIPEHPQLLSLPAVSQGLDTLPKVGGPP